MLSLKRKEKKTLQSGDKIRQIMRQQKRGICIYTYIYTYIYMYNIF